MTNKTNFLLDADSYKFSHGEMYPVGTNAMHSYGEARVAGKTIIPFGMQMWLKKTLANPITQADIDEANDILTKHGEPFDKEGWEYILKNHDGYIPVTIRGIPEGLPVASQTPLYTVECTVERVKSVASWLETSLQRGVWYPTTIASLDYESRNSLEWLYEHGSDNPTMLDFALHSFASRGVTSRETAEIGGLAHLVSFLGTDDVVALKAARQYYNCDMAGYSVIASEHSVQCAYRYDGQADYLNRVIDVYGKPGAIVSVVMDGYDIEREVDLLCTDHFVTRIKEGGFKFVVRPDSGDMFEIVPMILEKLAKAFGTTTNSKGKKVINNVGVIQGDGIDRMTLEMLSQKVHDLGYAPECVIYGSGGGLLQKVNRDTFSFAQKTSAIRIGDEWISTVKAPKTDSGKKSKGGRQDSPLFVTFYENGKILVNDSLDTIRQRAKTGKL